MRCNLIDILRHILRDMRIFKNIHLIKLIILIDVM